MVSRETKGKNGFLCDLLFNGGSLYSLLCTAGKQVVEGCFVVRMDEF